MKAIFFLFIYMFGINYVFSQCPKSGLEVKNKDCESPKGLAVASVNCTELKVKWAGNENQNYLVKANAGYSGTDSIMDVKVSQPVCDNSGNCTASIETTAGTTINWSVQAVCITQGATTYSEPVNGPETDIPICDNVDKQDNSTELQVYPNPSKGMLTVDYTGAIQGSLQLTVYDINGTRVYAKDETASSNADNQYELNLQSLPGGAYMLQTINGNEVRKVKFVLIKE